MRLTDVLLDSEELVPVIVRVTVPFGVVGLVVTTVNVDVPLPLMDVGLNDALVPAGRLLTVKATLPLNPPDPLTVTL